jgi:dimethylargininase
MLPTITQILTRRPAVTVASGITTSSHLGVPDFKRTLDQFKAYIAAFSACRCDVGVLPPDDTMPDGHFVEDTAVIFREMAFICHQRNPSRAIEVASIADTLSQFHQVQLTGDNAYLEGGDVLFCADRVLIGLSSRTNREGAEQLQSALHDMQADIRVDFVPVEGVLHLKTGMTALSDTLILRSYHLQTDYHIGFAEAVTLPAVESYAANVLPINNSILIPRGYPTVEKLATRHYTNVIQIDMSEFEKMDGGLTCLSLRY